MKPLFIPLKAKYYFLFWSGKKTVDYRLYGPRWNRDTCPIGRPVTLSLGYGKAHRLPGVITDFTVVMNPQAIPAWKECYGRKRKPAACITIKIDRKSPEATKENWFWFGKFLATVLHGMAKTFVARAKKDLP